jgi:glycosyltransferase involved in cell wall biosynthesis
VICLAESNPGLVAFVLPTFECAGAQKDVILLANALVTRGVSVAILVLRSTGPLRSMIDPAIEVREVPGQRVRYAIPGLRKVIRDLKPRCVLSSGPNLNLLCLIAVRSLPRAEQPKIILREVNTPSFSEKHDPRWQDRIAYRILHQVYRKADRVVALTDGSRRELIEQFSIPDSKVSVMRSNAVITEQHSERIAGWDGEQGREAGLIVSVGRLSREKDLLLLLRAVALLSRRRPCRLVLIGDGSERPALEEFARTNGIADLTTFAGFDPDPFGWMMRAQVAVCSSLYEGLCNAIIEALGCGTPVVSTDCPYGPRDILQHGRFGTLVPVGDAEALAVGIEDALDRPVDRTSLIGRSLNYTADRAADSFLEIISDL